MTDGRAGLRTPALGSRVPRRGSALGRWVGRAWLRAVGWRFEGVFPDVARAVIIVAPHTSNWDFFMGLAVRMAVGFDARFLGKHTLFRPPLGWIMRRLGGTPVNRSVAGGVVNQVTEAIRQSDRFLLALSPEGTRRRVEQWRTGFYHIAHGAGVPIIPAALDYGRRVVAFGPPLQPTGDLEADIRELRRFFAGAVGKRPDLFAPGQA